MKWAAPSSMHSGADDDTDGWHPARIDHPDGGRSHTACAGLRVDELPAGGKGRLSPLVELLDAYRPQVVVLMIGSNDASAGLIPEWRGGPVDRPGSGGRWPNSL